MHIYPAIDLLHNKAVRLLKGDYDKVTVYHDHPVELAMEMEQKGATHLHVVDLEGARTGRPAHEKIIERICQRTNLFVEVGGGVRNADTVERLLATGVKRVILSTAIFEDSSLMADLLRQYDKAIAVAVDVRDGRVAVRGWQETTNVNGRAFCMQWGEQGVGTIIYTEISRDGMLSGVDVKAYRTVQEDFRAAGITTELIASGGLTRVEEIAALREIGIAGAILGKAMYEGKLPLEKALEAAREEKQ